MKSFIDSSGAIPIIVLGQASEPRLAFDNARALWLKVFIEHFVPDASALMGTADMVNGLVIDGHFISPHPFGPSSLAGGTSRDELVHEVSSTFAPHGITLHTVDNWELYHMNLGVKGIPSTGRYRNSPKSTAPTNFEKPQKSLPTVVAWARKWKPAETVCLPLSPWH